LNIFMVVLHLVIDNLNKNSVIVIHYFLGFEYTTKEKTNMILFFFPQCVFLCDFFDLFLQTAKDQYIQQCYHRKLNAFFCMLIYLITDIRKMCFIFFFNSKIIKDF